MESKLEAIRTTFRTMGIRSSKNIATHLLLENTYEHNLVADISKVDYLAGHKGTTNLQPLEGLPMFVDDIYVFGYLRNDECVFVRGNILCTTGPNSSAQNIVSRIVCASRDSFGKTIHTNIVQTVAYEGIPSTIRRTIARIEKDTNNSALLEWKKTRKEDPRAVFVAKVDVSEIPLDDLHKALPTFAAFLQQQGYGIYCIDYTQDFSGTLDRKSLVDYLSMEGFREQGDFLFAIDEDTSTILANTDSVGKHVCTWVSTCRKRTVRTKIYNKIVSNFEAGEVREKIGAHLADYVDCPNKHLRQTFLHPDVQARGCTRIEISIYAPQKEDTPEVYMQETLDSIYTKKGLFVVQPPSKQWSNLAEKLDRCLVLAYRKEGEIFVAWYGHSTTGRVSGVRIRPTKAKVDDDNTWERSIEWAIGDFGFCACPIFRIDILSAEEDIEIAPLRCYTKEPGAKTYLAASKRPMQLHLEAPDPNTMLPPTSTVSWVFRTKKCHSIGVEKSIYKIQEVPEIARDRTISILSTKNRQQRLLELQEAQDMEEWRRKVEEDKKEQNETRSKELESIAKLLEAKKQYEEESAEIYKIVYSRIRTKEIGKVSALSMGVYKILGYARCKNFYYSSYTKVLLENDSERYVVYATKAIQKTIDSCAHFFSKEKKMYWMPRYSWKIEIEICELQSFVANGETIHYNPIHILDMPDPDILHQTQKDIECCEDCILQKIDAPKKYAKAVDIEPGEYVCRKYATTVFRGAVRTILFLEGEEDEEPIYGSFLEKELEGKIVPGVEYLLCKFGDVRTTIHKKKDRLVAVVAKKYV